MATLKQRLHRKNSSGTYDTIHFESTSDLILRPSGRTVEQDLADYLPEVQNNDNVPESLKSSKLVIGITKAFTLGKEISFSGHTHNASNITSGTLIPGVVASTGTDYGTSRIRNIKAGTADLTAGFSSLDSGTLYVCYV